MKSSEKFRDTQSVPFMVDKTRKTTFSPTGKKTFFLKKKLRSGKCRIVPKKLPNSVIACWFIEKTDKHFEKSKCRKT